CHLGAHPADGFAGRALRRADAPRDPPPPAAGGLRVIPLPANFLARFALLAGVALALYAATWWVAIKPRAELAAERQAHAETRAAHAEVLTGLAEAAAEVARKASAARVAFAEARATAESDYNEGVNKAE